MSCITTYTGKHIDPCAPDPELFDIRDIAHALSLTCRGNGHVKTFFSVGQHCLNCAAEAAARGYDDRTVLACLIHDASEVYMSDVPSPFKRSLPGYRQAEREMMSLIYTRFLGTDLTAEEMRLVKDVDRAMLYYDLRELLNDPPEGEAPAIHIALDYRIKAFELVEKEYLRQYEILEGKRK